MVKLTLSHLEEIVKWTRSRNSRIRIYLQGTDKIISIYKYVRAEDSQGRPLPWIQAFGPRPPHIILSSYKISKIVIEEEGGQTTLSSIKELLSRLNIL